ncbi:MAG: HDOD domain-containing protein [Candidatus Thiodiazotropha sp. (ex Lucina aurantia)]|uniref:HDOD domain protein n=1 Tax=Candidatus Thiodiazotropha endolucinida TaxID=1655433 RepID=A0A7Z1AH90_9GAMM|nr:HDOD domain-containing protein [Candidatus Thiodiazotropha endolucinida]MBT3011348.1 HDOD domain-containing protein [Candidatus Thiodiazotropha sp. (ex Lucina pensylvanica)]MBT3023222.1 HDOD domain-containing protein [Candidatus Thiodiazotropha taylori]MBT3038305.1 HDOD domain-containing protein [Candidatus Thiodiazotropha sp. (ex Codakia orbicularis)]MBV2102999.1 HDOD domain-containing protein [Candidatus Thiodiazotropha sp. (ex Lucina aurantia)]MBT3030414.1 HDOD domain-containing protein 
MTPQQLVIEIESLVSLPDVCVKVNRLIDAPNYSVATLGEIISQDTDLSARLLRLVNSAFFNLKVPVETISRAITIIGTNELRNLVMATTAARIFTGIPGDLVDMTEYWRYSITAGVVAGELAKRCNVLHSERLFVMGVLHDIGRLAIYLKMPQESRDILLITGGDDTLLPDAENDVLGFTHMDVGEALLRKWKLPESIVSVVAHHHRPASTQVFQLETSLLSLAALLAYAEISGVEWYETVELVDPVVWKQTGLEPEHLEAVMEQMPHKVGEIMDVVLGPKVRPLKSQPH